MKRKLVAASIISASLTLTSCGYQGFNRYPCQDYENWTKDECIYECKATGTCTADVLPPEVFASPTPS